ncbi:MAG: hypothetical protein ACI841_000936, partial [Planctomycetota bacterium]
SSAAPLYEQGACRRLGSLKMSAHAEGYLWSDKFAAEKLCELFHHREQLPCVVLRTSRLFLE